MTAIPHYNALLRFVRARLAILNMTYETLDAIAGWSPGLTGKVLAVPSIKRLGPEPIFLMMNALGCELTASENPEMVARILSRTRYSKRKFAAGNCAWHRTAKKLQFTPDELIINARKGGIARAKKLSSKRRTAIARAAAKARWALAKPQAQIIVPAGAGIY
jgi:hypothetical protein